MKFVTWNVNGLRSAMRKGMQDALYQTDAEVICLQEIKCQQSQLRAPVLDGYSEHWNSSTAKKGYSGTLILSKLPTLSVSNDLDIAALDGEGRVITAEFNDFYLVNVYAPNAQSGLKRLPFRLEWDNGLQNTISDLENSKPVILCGDLNVAHHEIDLAHPTRNRGKSGFSDAERDSFNKLLALGYEDAFRLFEQSGEHYTFWRFNVGTREKNLGWRIDYFIVSTVLQPRVADCYHLPEVMGSDHCPVVLEID